MDPMDQRVRPQLPVPARPHAIAVPRRPFEQSPSVGKLPQEELAADRAEKAVEMGRMDAVGRELPHRGRLRRDVEAQQARCVPDGDRLHEIAGRKPAPPNRTDARSFDPGADGVCDPNAEEKLLRRCELWKRDDMAPDGGA